MCRLMAVFRYQVELKCLAQMEVSMAQVGRLQMFHRAMIHPDSLLGAPVPFLTALEHRSPLPFARKRHGLGLALTSDIAMSFHRIQMEQAASAMWIQTMQPLLLPLGGALCAVRLPQPQQQRWPNLQPSWQLQHTSVVLRLTVAPALACPPPTVHLLPRYNRAQ